MMSAYLVEKKEISTYKNNEEREKRTIIDAMHVRSHDSIFCKITHSDYSGMKHSSFKTMVFRAYM